MAGDLETRDATIDDRTGDQVVCLCQIMPDVPVNSALGQGVFASVPNSCFSLSYLPSVRLRRCKLDSDGDNCIICQSVRSSSASEKRSETSQSDESRQRDALLQVALLGRSEVSAQHFASDTVALHRSGRSCHRASRGSKSNVNDGTRKLERRSVRVS